MKVFFWGYAALSVVSVVFYWLRKGQIWQFYISRRMFILSYVIDLILLLWIVIYAVFMMDWQATTHIVGIEKFTYWLGLDFFGRYLGPILEFFFILTAFCRLICVACVIVVYGVILIFLCFVACGCAACSSAVQDAKNKANSGQILKMLEPVELRLVDDKVESHKCGCCKKHMIDEDDVILMTCGEHAFHEDCAYDSIR